MTCRTTKSQFYDSKSLLIPNATYEIPSILTLPHNINCCPVIVMLHGTGSNKDEAGNAYEKLAIKLAANGIASLRFDFIGTGDSSLDYIHYNLSSAISDVNAVIDFLNHTDIFQPQKIGILGWSQGGTIALLSANKNNRIQSVVTWAASVNLAKNIIRKDNYQSAKLNGYSWLEFSWREPLRLGLKWYEEVLNTDVLKEVEQIESPILAINGTRDNVVPTADAHNIVKASPNTSSRVLLIENADHTLGVFNKDLSLFDNICTETINWFKETLKDTN